MACIWCILYQNHWDIYQCETKHYLYLKKNKQARECALALNVLTLNVPTPCILIFGTIVYILRNGYNNPKNSEIFRKKN